MIGTKKYWLWLIVLLFIASTAIAQEDGQLSMEEFQADPTVDGFDQLSSADRDFYISQVTAFGGTDFDIAEKYFDNTANVNANLHQFGQFMAVKGIDVTVEEGVGVQSYSADGTLTGANQDVNLNDFKDVPEKLKIDASGNIFIIDADGKEWPFKGSLQAHRRSGASEISIEEGEIAGKRVSQGNLKLEDGKARGSATSFAGLEFEEAKSFQYSTDENRLYTEYTTVTDIAVDTEVTLVGDDIALPEGDHLTEGSLSYKEGRAVKVGSDSVATVDNFKHTTSGDLHLLYAESSELTAIDRREQQELVKYDISAALKREKEEKQARLEQLKSKKKELNEQRRAIRKEIEESKRTQGTTEAQKQALEEKNNQIREEINSIWNQIEKARNSLRDTTDKTVPLAIKQEEIKRKYQQKRNGIYDDLIDDIKPEGNYFIQGNDRIWLGGDSFSSEVKEGNEIFPEFESAHEEGTTRQRSGRLRFSPKGGEMDIEKVSYDDHPLALSVRMSGEGEINNGKWDLIADGEEILGRTVESEKRFVASDMHLDYSVPTEEGVQHKTYDLDVDTEYRAPLDQQHRIGLENEAAKVEQKITETQQKIDAMKQDPVRGEKIKQVEEQTRALRQKLDQLNDEEDHWWGQERRATENPHPNAKRQQEILKKIEDNYKRIKSERQKVYDEIKKAEEIPEYLEFNDLQQEVRQLGYRRDNARSKLRSDIGERKTGVFGQIVSSQDGNARLSYEEFVEGFPVIKNTDIYGWTEEIYNPEAGVTVGGEVLTAPEIAYTGEDKLNLDMLNRHQECIDTQFRMAYEYARKTGQNICFNNGETCLRDYRNPKQFITRWMATEGTIDYQGSAERGWDEDINFIPPEDYGSIQPGDVILKHGHAIGVKEVIDVGGKKYVRQFAGSMPAIDAHVYQSLISVEELQEKRKAGDIVSVYRWKFRG